ncbi:MAG: hypothetical protein MZW92_75825 [Comamonadaceae bacterium]|nr:hypothetical protein [Comamonadaceae bacterium]
MAIDCYAGEIIRERSIFPWWNHWPVSQQIRSSGRWALAPDRVSHSSLAHIQSWQPYEETADGVTMLMLNGLTDKPAEALLPLAKSWLSPPTMDVDGRSVPRRRVRSDRTGLRRRPPRTRPARGRVDGHSPGLRRSLPPSIRPSVIRNWGAPLPRVEIDGRPAAARPGRPGRADARPRGRRPRPLDPGRMDLARPDLDRSAPAGPAKEGRDESAAAPLRLGGRIARAGRPPDGRADVRARRVRRPPRPLHGEDPRRRGRLPGRARRPRRTYAFRQGHDFAYLTGVHDPERLPRRRRPRGRRASCSSP